MSSESHHHVGANSNSPYYRAGEYKYLSSHIKNKFTSPPHFVLFKLSTDWMMPTHIGEENQLYTIHQLKC